MKATVVGRLRENPYTADCRIKVQVHEGVVTLDGRVGSVAAKRLASDDAEVVLGVLDVQGDLVVAQAA